jgi:23S rRNA pseudouridine1911/1915/1917 synthase
MSDPLTILYEDNHLLAVSKPAPMLTQAPPGVPSLEAMAKAYLKEKHHKPGNVYLGIPHRLDRPVSGVIVFARNTKAARRLAEQFQERQVRKLYWALVEGTPQEAEGRWEDWLLKIAGEARSERATPDTPKAKRAALRFRRLQSFEARSLLEMEPETGRMHQLRVQAALRGHPVLGDVLYGSRQPFGPPADLPRDRVIALHARELTLLHPIRFEPLTLTAPLPATWPR